MFICAKCGLVSAGEKAHKVAIVIRDVTYLIQIQYDRVINEELTQTVISKVKTVRETRGTEIVKEDTFCSKHIPKDFTPKVIKRVERKHIVAKKRLRNFDQEQDQDKKPRKERNGRTSQNYK